MQRSLDFLQQVEACNRCPARLEATQVVLPAGNWNSPIMFLGRNPGRDEDLSGKPFWGASGQILQEILVQLNLSRSEVLITNTILCYTSGNHPPTRRSLEQCLPWFQLTIQALRPLLIVSLGAEAFRRASATDEGIVHNRGRPRIVEQFGVRYIHFPMYHPGAILYKPGLRSTLFADVRNLKQLLEQAQYFGLRSK